MRSFLLLLAFAFLGCSSRTPIASIQLETLNGESAFVNPSENSLSVVFFLSPECPLCINYTLAMKELADEFQNDSVLFYGIHSGEWFSQQEVDDYKMKYNLPIRMLLDNGNHMANALGAKVTPEVFVLTSKSEILYSGKIDNWVNELGKKKLEVSEPYLRNALVAWQNGRKVHPQRTEPKGCLIE